MTRLPSPDQSGPEGAHSVAIRKATAQDADGILTCLAAAFEPYREQYTPAGFVDTVLTHDSVLQRLSTMCLFVALAAGRVVGTVGCRALGHGEGHLRGMAVLPEWQATGVATALLAAAERELRNNQCRRVTLDTTEPLQRAARFYQRHGFSASGRVSDFFGMRLYEYVKVL
jgi:GNAT superfamily N-acetyltransferase